MWQNYLNKIKFRYINNEVNINALTYTYVYISFVSASCNFGISFQHWGALRLLYGPLNIMDLVFIRWQQTRISKLPEPSNTLPHSLGPPQWCGDQRSLKCTVCCCSNRSLLIWWAFGEVERAVWDQTPGIQVFDLSLAEFELLQGTK